MPWSLGSVGHFGLAVRDPKKSARWWIKNFGLKKAFAFEDGVAIENDAITIVLFKGTPRPSAIDHMSFHLRSMRALREALADLRKRACDARARSLFSSRSRLCGDGASGDAGSSTSYRRQR